MKPLDTTLPGRDAVRAVGRFAPDGPTGFRAIHVPGAPLRETRAQAWEDAVGGYQAQRGGPADEVTRIGSLFSGYGGLDLGVIEALAVRGAVAEVAWHAEIEPGPCRVLAHHWPDAPNLGDVSAVDWSRVPRVHVLTLGFPCQDVSLAGLRAGLREGTRSGLWAEAARAIDVLRPELVVIENVRGLLSAKAGDPREVVGEMESDAWAVGDGVDGPVLRALGAVLGDLADLGYDARWVGVRAADAGAPHGRSRVFILAHPRATATDADRSRLRRVRRFDTEGCHHDGRDRAHQDRIASEPKTSNGWGPYAAAIARWEAVLGRVAPASTSADGRAGGHRLAPAFVEWMMGLPAGHVTDPAIGLRRTEQLKALGNGVVPQQAALAVGYLLDAEAVAA